MGIVPNGTFLSEIDNFSQLELEFNDISNFKIQSGCRPQGVFELVGDLKVSM